MRISPTLRAAAASLMLAACGGDDDASANAGVDASTGAVPTDGGLDAGGLMPVTLRFKGKIGSDDLVCDRRYEALGSSQIAGKAQDFRIFVHNVRLIDARGTEVAVQLDDRPPFQSARVALLDFTDGRGACTSGSPESNLVLTGAVPPGTYRGIAFTTGVPEDLNHADPSSAPPPLKQPGVFWAWRQGYRFVVAELNVNDGLASGAMDGGTPSADAGAAGGGGHEGDGQPGLVFAHIGSAQCIGGLGSFQCAQLNRSEIELTSFDPAKSFVVADLGAVFSAYDLRGVVQCTGLGDVCKPALSALGVDPASGAPAAGQSVFRSE